MANQTFTLTNERGEIATIQRLKDGRFMLALQDEIGANVGYSAIYRNQKQAEYDAREVLGLVCQPVIQ